MPAQIKAPVLTDRIAQGRGTDAADLVLKNVRLFDLVTGALLPTDIAICGPTIVGPLAITAGYGRLTAGAASPCLVSLTPTCTSSHRW
jgi:adenine deaminase